MQLLKHPFALMLSIAIVLCGCGQQPEMAQTPAPVPTQSQKPQKVTTDPPLSLPTAVTVREENCTQIAFSIADADTRTSEVVVACSDGTGLGVVSPDEMVSGGPSWSPDGRQLAFVGQLKGARAQVYVVDVDGGNLKQITSDESDVRVIWRPDGRTLSIQSTDDAGLYWWKDYDLIRAEVVGSTERTYDFHFLAEAWSPDGTQVAYMSLVEQAERNDGSAQIHVRGLDGTDDRALTADVWANMNPTWSPDGQEIAFLSEMGHYNSYSLYVMSVDGSRRREVHAGPFEEYAQISWSPDGRLIAIDSALAEHTGIQIVDIEAGASSQLPAGHRGGQASDPAWRPVGHTAP